MPLIKSDSDEALQKNIETEIRAGRPKDQAIAIALDIQKRAKAKKRRSQHATTLDPAKKLEEVNFEAIKQALMKATPEDGGDGAYVRMAKVGTVETLSPSGKYFIWWTKDHSNPEIEADAQYWQMFQERLEGFEFPAWLEQDDGNIYVGAHFDEDHQMQYSLGVGDLVKWDSSGGQAQGKIKKIVRDGTVPGIPVKVTGTKDDPAAQIEVYKDGKPSGVLVGHKLSTLKKV